MNMDKLIAAKRAERASKGLIARNGVACATYAQLAYENAKYDAKLTGRRDAATTTRLVTLKAAMLAAHGKGA